MSFGRVFKPEKVPSLSRIPREVGRKTRRCERCAKETEHILYRVPRKVAFLYFKEHENNLHATCIECARSEILTGEERERALREVREPA